MSTWQAVIAGLIPSLGVGGIFWFVMRSIVRADRHERKSLAEYEAQQDASAQAAQSTTP